MWLSTNNHLHGFARTSGPKGEKLTPLMTIATGPRDIQDIIVDAHGRPVYASAKGGYLATISYFSACDKIWTLSPGVKGGEVDASHVSGVADDGDQVRYVTVFNRKADEFGWQGNYVEAGELLDVVDDKVIAGATELGYVDAPAGAFTPFFQCPGYPMALTFHEGFAFIGLSSSVSGITPASGEAKGGAKPSGMLVVDIDKARILHWIRFRFDSAEVAGVALLPQMTMPILELVKELNP